MPILTLAVSSLLQVCLAGSAAGPADAPAPVWVFFKDNRATPASIADTALRTWPDESVLVTFPVPAPSGTSPSDFFAFLKQQGFLRVWLFGNTFRTDRASDALTGSLSYRYSGHQHNQLYNTTTRQYNDPNPGRG